MLLSCDGVVDRNAYATSLLELVDIPIFMRYDIRVIDDRSVIHYKLKYRTSLKQVLGDVRFTMEKMSNVILSIVEVLCETENYLLNPECVMWRSDTTFIEINSGRLLFSYYPIKDDEHSSLKDFLVELIQYIDKKDEQVYLYIMEFYNLVTNPDCEVFQLAQFTQRRSYENLLQLEDAMVESVLWNDSSERSVEDKKERYSWVTTGVLTVVNLVVVFLLLFEVWTYQYIWVLAVTFILLLSSILLKRPLNEEKEMDQIMEEYLTDTVSEKYKSRNDDMNFEVQEKERYEETSILTFDQQEIVLEDRPQVLYLKSMNPKKYTDIIMDKSSMVIGCMKSGCDYLVPERGISRMHTKLIKKEDGLYVFDMNSTNQTFLNEQPLTSGTEYRLKEGDVLCLAGVVNFVVVEKAT